MVGRYYTAQPIDFEGDAVTVEGLSETLAAVQAQWGGKLLDAKRFSPSLSIGAGAALLATEAGRVMVIRDDAATAQARMREAYDKEKDGRLRNFGGIVTISRRVSSGGYEELATMETAAPGLMGLMFVAAMFVQEKLGDVPSCMYEGEVTKRERAIRAQIARAKTQNQEGSTVVFPSSASSDSFELRDRPGEHYFVTVFVKTDAPEAPDNEAINIMRPRP